MTIPTENYIDNYYVRTLAEDAHYPALADTIEADVCVIGGGLAGINTALGLIERGKKVVLLEAHRVGWGASGRNAGFVTKGYAAGEASLIKRLGLEKARKLVGLTKNARGLIKKRIDDFGIDCGPIVNGVLTVSWRNKTAEVRQSVQRANKNFDFGLEFWPRARVQEHFRTEKYFDGSFSPHDFHFNPLRYLRGLVKVIAADEKKGQIFENSAVVQIEPEGEGWIAYTATGKVKAQHVVLCCACYMEGVDSRLENASFPVQTYAMTTKPIDPQILKSAINSCHAVLDTRFCGDYYRILPDNRLLWGGRVGLWAHPKNIAQAMRQDMYNIYPQLKGHVKPETAWSGKLCYAPHKMPQIGQLEPGYWYNTGFGGHGLCSTTVGGEVVAAAIAGGDMLYKEFAPFGLSYAGGKMGRYAAQMVYGWWRARDYMNI